MDSRAVVTGREAARSLEDGWRDRLLRAAAGTTGLADLLDRLVRQEAPGRPKEKLFSAQLARLNGDRIVVEATVNVDLDDDRTRSLTPVGMSVPLATTILARVESAGTTCWWPDVLAQPDLPGYDRLAALGIRSVLATPFSVSGTTYFVTLVSQTADDFSADDRTYVEALSVVLERHLYQTWQADRIRFQAAHDPLTGLLNRQRFRSSLRAALAVNDACAVAILDLAGFRSVVERVGDMVGDALLVEVGAFLAGAMEFGEIASRLGGDVFGICLPGIGTREAANGALERLLARFRGPFATGDRTGKEGVALGARIGVSLKPSDGSNADELMVRAQAAVVAMKSSGPGRIAFFEPALESQLVRPPVPANDAERVAALHRFEILDTPPEPAFDRITRLAAKLLRAPMARITFVDEHRQWFKSQLGVSVAETPRDEAFCAHVINDAGVFVVHDARVDPRFRENPSVVGEPNIRFYAGAPLVTPEGVSVGAMCVMDDRPRDELSRADAETLNDLAGLVVAELGTRRAIGYVDATTHLPNQVRLRDDLDAFIDDPGRGAASIAVVVVETADPGRYEELVRTLGNDYSDKFVLATARVLRSAIPPRAKLFTLAVCRFAIVLSDHDLADADGLLAGIAAAFAAPIPCADIDVATRASIGLAAFPGDGQTGDGIIRAAISAARDARNDHRSWARYNRVSDDSYRRAFRLLSDLPAARAARGQLSMVYQPTIDLLTGRCIGAEALVRWKHPLLGAVPPAEFVALAERTGIVRPLTDWIFAETIEQIARWRDAGIDLKIGINASMLDLDDPEFAARVGDRLSRHGVPVGAIEIELTESALVREDSTAVRQLNELHTRGIDIAIDDFGTGQSAHGYLKRIPATTVKIDQSFIHSVATVARDQMIVGSMIELAHGFGYRVIAEGIESDPVREWLRLRDCDFGQGYLFARPLAADAFTAWLAADSGRPPPERAART